MTVWFVDIAWCKLMIGYLIIMSLLVGQLVYSWYIYQKDMLPSLFVSVSLNE